jgi:hypothetical protein
VVNNQENAMDPMFIDLPEHVQEQTDDLGGVLLHCRASAAQSLSYLVFGVLAVVFGVALGIFLLVALFAPGGRMRGTFRGGVIVFVLISSGVGMLAKWSKLRGASVFAFEGGLARVQGDLCEAMRWEEIKTIRRGRPPEDKDVTIGTPRRLTLVGKAGLEWVLTESFSNLKELRDVVEECSLACMIPAANQEMRAGQSVSFGNVSASLQGLTSPDKSILAWEHVSEAKIDKGKVVIGSTLLTKPWYQAPVYQVPNAHLLLALVENATRDQFN